MNELSGYVFSSLTEADQMELISFEDRSRPWQSLEVSDAMQTVDGGAV